MIYPITVVAFSLLNSSITTIKNRSVSLQQLFTDKDTLFSEHNSVLEHFSCHYQIFWPSTNDHNNIRQRILSLYSDVFEIVGTNRIKLKVTGNRLTDGSLIMKLIMYRNTCLHLFAKPAYILLACQVNSQVNQIYWKVSIFVILIVFRSLNLDLTIK